MSPEADRLRAAFLKRLGQERALSPHTQAAYGRDLAALAAWCELQGLTEWPQLDHGHVRLFAAQSHAKGLGPRSVQRRLSAVRSFYVFLLREGLASHNPAVDVRAPKAPRRLPRTVDADLMQRVLEGRRAGRPRQPAGRTGRPETDAAADPAAEPPAESPLQVGTAAAAWVIAEPVNPAARLAMAAPWAVLLLLAPVNPPGAAAERARYSLPFFLHPNSEFSIATLSSCIDAERPNRYPTAITAEAYLAERLREIGLLSSGARENETAGCGA